MSLPVNKSAEKGKTSADMKDWAVHVSRKIVTALTMESGNSETVPSNKKG